MPEDSHTDAAGPTTEYDPERDAYVADHRSANDEELSVTVVHAVLEATDAEPTDLNLNAVVQPDALNRIFATKHGGAPRRGGTLRFEFGGCLVIVHGDGEVVVDPDP
jgi:hypothetical protein